MRIKKALIVAAGLSSRLYPLTSNMPKGLLEINGQSLLKRSVDALKNSGIEQVGIVVGYKDELLKTALGNEVAYIANPFYQHCNNMGSMWFGKDFIGTEPFLYVHGDVVYDAEILQNALENSQASDQDWILNLVTDFGPVDEEAMKVKLNSEGYLIESNKGIAPEDSAGEWIGMAVVHQPQLIFEEAERALFDGKLNDYDTYAFTQLAQKGHRIFCSPTNGLPWVEMDFIEDYERAKGMFNHE